MSGRFPPHPVRRFSPHSESHGPLLLIPETGFPLPNEAPSQATGPRSIPTRPRTGARRQDSVLVCYYARTGGCLRRSLRVTDTVTKTSGGGTDARQTDAARVARSAASARRPFQGSPRPGPLLRAVFPVATDSTAREDCARWPPVCVGPAGVGCGEARINVTCAGRARRRACGSLLSRPWSHLTYPITCVSSGPAAGLPRSARSPGEAGLTRQTP